MTRIVFQCAITFTALAALGLGVTSAAAEPTLEKNPAAPRFLDDHWFEIAPLETVSEISSNASIGDLNGDGHLDIVLVKGTHWRVTSRTFLGDGNGHVTPGPALPSKAAKSYSALLADMTKSGHLDIVLSNDQPDRMLVLLNDGKGHFKLRFNTPAQRAAGSDK